MPTGDNTAAESEAVLIRYATPHLGKSIWQLANSLGLYLLFWYLMYLSIAISYWLTLGLSIIAAGFLIRIFIIFHDCGHGSFFTSSKANTIVGYLTGILTFTPYHHWRHEHAMHHATAGDLDRRGHGDVWTMTVRDYAAAKRWERIAYRIYRNPLTLFCIGPFILFVVKQRFVTRKMEKFGRWSIHLTNAGLLALILLLSATIGFTNYFIIQFPIMIFASIIGVWLFYVQHQFEDVYWNRHERWNYEKVALEGSSYYQLPRLLQWFTGNIGFHHVHHLRPRIPNYHLEQCSREHTALRKVAPVTLASSLQTVRFRLWDEEERRMTTFRRAFLSRKMTIVPSETQDI